MKELILEADFKAGIVQIKQVQSKPKEKDLGIVFKE